MSSAGWGAIWSAGIGTTSETAGCFTETSELQPEGVN
jgi:hypothetical protein